MACDDVIASDLMTSFLGGTDADGPTETYTGATRTLGGVACTWQTDGNLSIVSLVPHEAVPDRFTTDTATECVGGGRCHVTRTVGPAVLFVEGWDGQTNRMVTDAVAENIDSIELASRPLPSATAPTCDSLAPLIEPTAGIGTLSALGTDDIPQGPIWDTLVEAGAATFCVWGGTESTGSLTNAAWVWAYPGLMDPRGVEGERLTLDDLQAVRRDRPSDHGAARIEVTASDGSNTVVVLGQGMTVDAVSATVKAVLSALPR